MRLKVGITNLREENKVLKEYLKLYGNHFTHCAFIQDKDECSCGFQEALDASTGKEGKS